MDRRTEQWLGGGALAAIFVVTGCQIIAYGGDDGGTKSATTSTSATGTTATTNASVAVGTTTATTSGGNETCSGKTSNACASGSDCQKFCTKYNSLCTGANADYGAAGCCAICQTFDLGNSLTGNTLACRNALVLTASTLTKDECAAAGPASSMCGSPDGDANQAFKQICDCPTAPTAFTDTTVGFLDSAAANSLFAVCGDDRGLLLRSGREREGHELRHLRGNARGLNRGDERRP